MKVRKSELLFYTAYTIYYLLNVLYTTRIGNLFGVVSLNDLSLIITPFVLICTFAAFLKSISKRFWLVFSVVSLATGAISYNSGVRAIFISVMFILCARNINLEDLCRFTFKMNTVMIVMVILLSFTGLIPGEVVVRGSITRYSLGFASSNTLAMAVLKSVLLYYIVSYEKKNLKKFAMIAVVIATTYSLTGSRLFLITGIVFLIMVIYEIINPKAYTSKFTLLLGETILPLLTVATLYFGSVYWLKHDELISLNELFSGRLYFINYFLTNYGVSTWGQRIQFTTVRDSLSAERTWFALDNSYAYALVCYGLIFFIIIAVAYTVEIYVMHKTQRKEIFIYLICMLIIGLTENGIFDVTFNFALIYIAKALMADKVTARKEVAKS